MLGNTIVLDEAFFGAEDEQDYIDGYDHPPPVYLAVTRAAILLHEMSHLQPNNLKDKDAYILHNCFLRYRCACQVPIHQSHTPERPDTRHATRLPGLFPVDRAASAVEIPAEVRCAHPSA